jgi:hypothetical protein
MDHVCQGTDVYQVYSQNDRILVWEVSSHLEFLICRSPSLRVSRDVYHRAFVHIKTPRRGRTVPTQDAEELCDSRRLTASEVHHRHYVLEQYLFFIQKPPNCTLVPSVARQ